MEAPVAFLGHERNFAEFSEHNPCDGCSAPCCRLVILAQGVPETFRALDRLRYLLVHAGTELLLDRRGNWHLSSENPCTLLTDDRRCSVHGTAAQPKICVNYSAHGCWYKRNFHEVEEAPDLIRMDLAAFDRVVAEVGFDGDGRVTHVPSYDELRRLAGPLGGGPTL